MVTSNPVFLFRQHENSRRISESSLNQTFDLDQTEPSEPALREMFESDPSQISPVNLDKNYRLHSEGPSPDSYLQRIIESDRNQTDESAQDQPLFEPFADVESSESRLHMIFELGQGQTDEAA